MAGKLNVLRKYVVSRTLKSVSWPNSSLLAGDVVEEVTKLKKAPREGNLQVHGSGALAHTLIEHDLIDEYRLLYFPVHLGSGKKLFADGAKAAGLHLVNAKTTGTGVIIANYEPAWAGTVRVVRSRRRAVTRRRPKAYSSTERPAAMTVGFGRRPRGNRHTFEKG